MHSACFTVVMTYCMGMAIHPMLLRLLLSSSFTYDTLVRGRRAPLLCYRTLHRSHSSGDIRWCGWVNQPLWLGQSTTCGWVNQPPNGCFLCFKYPWVLLFFSTCQSSSSACTGMARRDMRKRGNEAHRLKMALPLLLLLLQLGGTLVLYTGRRRQQGRLAVY